MRHPLPALFLLLAAETAAVACSCVRGPLDAVQRQQLARDVARGASALVEAEALTGYDDRTGRGERLRVRRVLAGRSPATVELRRHGRPNGGTCDIELRPGDRFVVLLYPEPPIAGRPPLRRPSSSCTGYLLRDAPFRQAVIGAMRRRP